jgi:pyruvate dehydrogenase E2 component (dihydrolipoamide acetyltransferase)
MTDSVLLMPRLGETMEDGVLVGWLVEPGQPFKRGDPLVEIETDKTVAEFPALSDGVLVEPLVQIGDRVKVGTPIARLDVPGEAVASSSGPEARAPAAPPPVATTMPEHPAREAASETERLRATPLARRIARQSGIDLASLRGTGRRGRIERRDVEAASAREQGIGRHGGIALREDGPATGPSVFFLHGFAADHTVWAGLSALMAKAGCRTVAADLPGHGATTLEAATPADLAAPLHDIARDAAARGPLHLVAHSMGAIPAVALAAAIPTASLTLIAPAGLGHTIDAGFIRGLARARVPGEVAHLLDRMTDGPNGLSETAIAAIAATLAQGRLTRLADSLLGETGQAVNIRADLARLAERIPVHLILGHRARILDWRESLDVSPRIAIHHLPRAGHMPQWEAIGDVAAILTGIIGPW